MDRRSANHNNPSGNQAEPGLKTVYLPRHRIRSYLSIYLSIDFLLRRLILSVLCCGAVSRVVGRVSNPKMGFISVVLGLLEVPQALTGLSSHFLALSFQGLYLSS